MPKIVDLTHPVAPGMTTWPGDPEVERRSQATIDRDGYDLGLTIIGDHAGTHIGVAAHMDRGGVTVDRLPVELLIREAVVIDLRDAQRLTSVMILAWETDHGMVPDGSVVLIWTGRSLLFSDRMRYRGAARLDHPGVGLDAARFLAEERNVVGLGIDSLGIDPGDDESFATNRYWLQDYRYHLENLTRLEELPATGTTLYVAPLPIVNASGAPARVIGIVG